MGTLSLLFLITEIALLLLKVVIILLYIAIPNKIVLKVLRTPGEYPIVMDTGRYAGSTVAV